MVEPWNFYVLMAGAAILIVGILLCEAGACMSLGNNRMKRIALWLPIGGALVVLGGLGAICYAYMLRNEAAAASAQTAKRLMPMIPGGLYIFAAGAAIILVLSLVIRFLLPRKRKKSWRWASSPA